MTMRYGRGTTPFGPAIAVVDEQGRLAELSIDVVGRAQLGFGGENKLHRARAVLDLNACEHIFTQLDEYFAGTRRDFDLPLALEGSEFEIGVWKELLAIPFGSTDSYGALASRLGAQTHEGAREVGKAAGANRIPIVVPCHRLVGSDGKLVGYALGLPMKQRLLDLESAATLTPRLL